MLDEFPGLRALPLFCAVGRLAAPFNASSASWKGLSIRRRDFTVGAIGKGKIIVVFWGRDIVWWSFLRNFVQMK